MANKDKDMPELNDSGSPELASLKQQRATMKRNITCLEKKIDKDGDTADTTILQCRLEILESYFKQISHIQGQIEKISPSDVTRSDLEEIYIAAKAKLLSILNKTRSSTSMEQSFFNTSIELSNQTRLSSLKLPRFDGKYTDYKRFITTFNNMVHDNSSITPVDKFNYLLNCLSGPALSVVEPFQVTDENYPKALDRLRERYDNKVLIFLEHITTLFNIPEMSKGDSVSLRYIIDTVSAIRGSLLSLGSELDIMNAIIIHIVLSKLDDSSKQNYDEKLDFRSLPSWDTCYDILSHRCQFLESHGKKSEQKSSSSGTNNLISSRCRVCQSAHHTSLHIFVQPESAPVNPAPPETSTNNATSLVARSFKRAIIPTAVVLIKDSFGCSQPVRVLLDSCSEINFITEETAKKLKLRFLPNCQDVSGISEIQTKIRYSVAATIKSQIGTFQWSSTFAVTKSISAQQPGEKIDTTRFTIPETIQLADPLFYKPQRIDLLISTEIFFDLLLEGRISLGHGMPCLVNTVFGWIVGGKFNDQKNPSTLTFEEYVSGPQTFTNEEQACEKHFTENVQINSDRRIQVRLPFKQNPNCLGESFEISKRRFLSLERKLERDPTLKSMYVDFVNEYLALGHMSLYNRPLSHPHYIIPHHCVLKPESTTTKLRVVFDGSARTTSNHSLNDILMVGPTIQQDLVTTLFSFRLNRFALTADISKMYRQFLVDERDRKFQLVLWRSNSKDKLCVFQLNTVTYGLSAAPFLAIRSLFIIADQHSSTFPIGSKLAKWNSNCPDFVTNNDEEVAIKTTEENITKTLGMSWNPTQDIFLFRFNLSDVSNPTKRSILSIVAKIFDLLGLLSPIVVRCKMLVQEMWVQNIGWDDPLNNSLTLMWLQIKADLEHIHEITIPRYVFTSENILGEIHGFADASQRAFGCCIYYRVLENGSYKTTLLIAKSKVAPIKAQSLPRLELCAQPNFSNTL
ncbi:uncharacterized protein LOC124420605 [Lucilia cuprina]|uniref:uncharacterized protein LOC124420605 n=1 Tax=Lucilia cuprina TaxID=7375 RepID=UPI001F065E4C|nr:uncharacterized protein LOC124420605 [Lucilia cuprina]